MSLWENYNYKHDYPVYVHYFDDVYDEQSFQEEVENSCPQNVIFRSIPYNTPKFISEDQLYYNRKDLWYVNSSFPKSRKGYLHMCNFTSNMYGYDGTELENYDYIMTHDDESGYDQEMTTDPFLELSNTDCSMGAFFVGQRLKNGSPHQGHFDTRVGLWEFTRNFLIDNSITPKSSALEDLISDKESNINFHLLQWCDTYVIKTEIFKSDLWKKWITAVNEAGGIYKYRWGDNEIVSLFCHIVQSEIYDFDLVKSGIHNQGKFRRLQDIAPSVKDLSR